MARVERITIMVEEGVKEQFHQWAVNFGLTESVLGGFIIGKFIHEQKAAQPMMEFAQSAILEVVKAQMADLKQNIVGGEWGEESQIKEENCVVGLVSVCDQNGQPLKPGDVEYERLLRAGIKAL